jgi:hypothetical protein
MDVGGTSPAGTPGPPRTFTREVSLAVTECLCSASINRRHHMSKLTALIGFIFLSVSSVWAQTPAPSPAPGAPPAGDAGAADGGIMDYWWLIVLAIIVIAAIVYFSRRRRSM